MLLSEERKEQKGLPFLASIKEKLMSCLPASGGSDSTEHQHVFAALLTT